MSYSLDDEEKARVDASDGWPVVRTTSRDKEGVDYAVAAGGYGDAGDNSRVVWSRRVEFKRRVMVAGGIDFQRAARRQEEVAEAVVAHLRGGGR